MPSILVSSATADVPRHLVAVELARAFKALHRKTLLIDADSSNPALTRWLGAEELVGIIQACAHEADPRQCVVPCHEEGIDFLPLGLHAGGKDWIAPETLKSVVETLRKEYPVILVNGPALMSSGQSLVLASYIDQTAFAVFAGKSSWNQLAKAETTAAQAKISVLGSVLHSGDRTDPLTLRMEQAAAAGATHEAHIDAEDSLQQGIAAMQEELDRAASQGKKLPTEPVRNQEFSS